MGEGPTVRRSYKFRLRPTSKQEAALGACLEDTRQLYNAALEERREAWRTGHHKVTFYSQDAQLKEIRAGDRSGTGAGRLTARGLPSAAWTARFRGSSVASRPGRNPATRAGSR